MLDTLFSFHRVFRRQNYEEDYFDVIFNVDGRVLYAHSGILAAVSPVFKELFIKNRSFPNQSIQIDGFTYHEFKEFIDAIYCTGKDIYLHEDYIYSVIELSHNYKIDTIKEECAKRLVKTLSPYGIEECFKAMEAIYKYTWTKFDKKIKEFINVNIYRLIEFKNFVNLDKSVIQAFVIFAKNIDDQEELCEAICQWGKYQAMITVEMSDEEKNKLILHQIKDILPFFTFNTLLEFFVNENGLISVNEAKKVKTIQVTIKSRDESISGTFIDIYGIFEIIKYFENKKLDRSVEIGRIICPVPYISPSTPSVIQKREGIEWYLVMGKDRDDFIRLHINLVLYVKHQSMIKKDDYIIAEMKTSNENGEGGEFMIEDDVDVYATVSRKHEQIF